VRPVQFVRHCLYAMNPIPAISLLKSAGWIKGQTGASAAYIFGIATLALAILSYIRPPDPAHPVSLDFLSRTIAIPSWLAVMLLVSTAAVTYAITRNVKSHKAALPTNGSASGPPPAIGSLTVLDKTAIEELSAKHKKKVWIYLRNDGQTCLKLEDPDWKSDQDPTIRDSRIRGHIVYRVFNY
jgi:hypothetical protein